MFIKMFIVPSDFHFSKTWRQRDASYVINIQKENQQKSYLYKN